ncbi:MAG TPA: hypothetical protein VFH99_02745 [Candidatus Saccharimonadales bacterium]|nr:hypothetical protein [Candidatus Saccharimonadales bacterium]
MAKIQRKVIDKVFIMLGVCATAVLLVVGGLAWYGYSFTHKQVKDELSSQKIYFPLKGSAAFSPAEFPDLQKYAGQQVDTGIKAKAYANDFIGRHIKKIADGQTYSQVSTAAQADPTNATLQQEKSTLFQGETLRGLLLNAYAFDTLGMISYYVAITAFIGAIIFALLVLAGLGHLKRLG